MKLRSPYDWRLIVLGIVLVLIGTWLQIR